MNDNHACSKCLPVQSVLIVTPAAMPAAPAVPAVAVGGGAGDRELVLMDVTPLSLGIETSNGGMSVVIRR